MTGKIIVTDPTKSVIPLEDFFRSEMSGDTQFVRIFMPSLKPIPEVDIPIGIKFTNDVEFSGNPITISLVNDGWEVISSKKIYPQNIDEKIISHIRLESEDNCEPCAVHVNYNGFTTQVPFFFSNGPFLFIPDKQVYSPNDQVELTFISPQSNITPNMDTLGPIVIQDGTAPLRADISFDAMENDFESGVFIASLKLVPSSNEPLCVESMTNHSAELKQELSQMRLLCVYDGDDGSLKKHGRQDLPVGINNELLGGWVFSIRVSDDGSTSVDHVHLDGTSHDHVNGNKAHVHESQLSSENQEQFSSIQINGNNVDVTDAPPFVVNDDSIITFSGVVNVSSLSDGLANVVTVQILSPSPPGDSYGGTHNDIISVEQITPDQQGNFSLDILPQGSAWNLAGYYQIKIFYDGAEEHYMINFLDNLTKLNLLVK